MLEFWPIILGSADASEAFGCCASSDDSGTFLRPPPTLQQRYYRACVPGPLPPLIQSSLQNSMVPAKPLEILAEEAIRTVCRWTGGVRNGHRSRGQSSGRGTTSRRRVMSLASSTSQVGGHLMICTSSWTLASILTHSALHTLATRKLYRHTSPTHPDLCFQTQPAHSGRHADGYGFHKLHRDNTPSCTVIRDTQDTEGGKLPRFLRFLRGWKLLSPGRTRTVFSPERVAINRSKTGLGGSTAHGRVWRVDGAWTRSLWSCCAVPRGPRDFSRCAHGNWCRRPLRSRVRGPSSLHHQFRTDFLKTSLCTKLDILAPASIEQ